MSSSLRSIAALQTYLNEYHRDDISDNEYRDRLKSHLRLPESSPDWKRVYFQFNVHQRKMDKYIKNDDLEMVKIMNMNGFDYNTNMLVRAAEKGSYNVAKFLIENRVKIDEYNHRALIVAIESGNTDIAKLLLESCGPKQCRLYGPNYKARNNLPIILASKTGQYDLVKMLIEYGADVTVNNNKPIRVASKYGHDDIVQLLIEHGADVSKIVT